MWTLSFLLCAAVAAFDAASGAHLILIGLLITGPCCALLTGRWVPTAWTSSFAVSLGPRSASRPDFATFTHYAFLAAVIVVGLAMLSAAIIQHQRA